MRFLVRGFIRLCIQYPPLGFAVLALLALAAVLWYRDQVQETKDGEALRRGEGERHDSIWNDDIFKR